MARVFVDTHMFGEAWFVDTLKDLINCDKVIFVYGEIKKLDDEISRVRSALEFWKIIRALRTKSSKPRAVEVPNDELNRRHREISENEHFVRCKDCDDPHIFALVFAKPTPFVFSMDHRMARCRSTIRTFVDRRFCQFIVIADPIVYNSHRAQILR